MIMNGILFHVRANVRVMGTYLRLWDASSTFTQPNTSEVNTNGGQT